VYHPCVPTGSTKLLKTKNFTFFQALRQTLAERKGLSRRRNSCLFINGLDRIVVYHRCGPPSSRFRGPSHASPEMRTIIQERTLQTQFESDNSIQTAVLFPSRFDWFGQGCPPLSTRADNESQQRLFIHFPRGHGKHGLG
jgi:hypothetical protein